MHLSPSATWPRPTQYTFDTLVAFKCPVKERLALYGGCVYNKNMVEPSPISRRLKLLRQRAGLSIREVAHALGMEHGSSYQHYEDRFRKPHLPLELAQRLAPIFAAKGIAEAELYALAGVDGSRGRAVGAKSEEAAPGMLKIEELELRASAGDGLTGENQRVIAEWQLPSEVVRFYSTAPASELRIITVMGDSMEPTLQPGQRVLVDTGDRTPSPPGVFVVWDGLGLVVKRVQALAHTEPMRVKIGSDNPKYKSYERTLAEAYIQGRVIGQWRWL